MDPSQPRSPMDEDPTPRIDEEPTSELVVSMSRTALALFSAGSVEATLRQVVELTVATIEGCDFAGIELAEGRSPAVRVYTDPIVAELDAVARRTGESPGLDAWAHGGVFSADDLEDDARWPRFGPAASALGIRSVLALALSGPDADGVLDLSARYARAFGVIDRAKALILGALAGLAVSAARSYENEERRVEDLHAALATRDVIGQAQGILMERERISADEAFDVLRRASQHLNRKLRQVAQDLVDTGEWPHGSPPAP